MNNLAFQVFAACSAVTRGRIELMLFPFCRRPNRSLSLIIYAWCRVPAGQTPPAAIMPAARQLGTLIFFSLLAMLGVDIYTPIPFPPELLSCVLGLMLWHSAS